MNVRQHLVVRLAAIAWVVLALWLVVDEPTPQMAAHLGIALVMAAASLRALIVWRGGALSQRGLRGWGEPVRVEDIAKVSLRREPSFRRFPLTLRITGGALFAVTGVFVILWEVANDRSEAPDKRRTKPSRRASRWLS